MTELEKRYRRAKGSMTGNESLAASLEDDAAGELLSWGEAIAKRIVNETTDMDDDTAEEYTEPRLRALRLMMRAAARWAGESKKLDKASRLELWNRMKEQALVLFGDSFDLPDMNDVSDDMNAQQMIAWLKNTFEKNKKG